MRTMINEFEGWRHYESAFNPETGQIVRIAYENEEDFGHFDFLRGHPKYGKDPRFPIPYPQNATEEEYREYHKLSTQWREDNPDLSQRWRRKYGWRGASFSPSPETIDVKITNFCGFGCPYCYMDSTPQSKSRCDLSLFEAIFEGLDHAPYQIAIGGGEPTTHPQFVDFLKFIREKGTVPNYTTAGHNLTPEIAEATNKYCGGVAISYHPHKGVEWFVKTFKKWKAALRVQLNTHLIAGRGCANHLRELVDAFVADPDLSPQDLRIVVLAYYTDVGRSNLEGMMTKTEYMVDFPNAIVECREKGLNPLAFSEGMLPYFLSRPGLADTTMATPQEGRFSCYVDEKGNVSDSSFSPMQGESPNLFEHRFQEIWNRSVREKWGPQGGPCFGCDKRVQCSAPQGVHMLQCAYQNHNRR